MIPYTIDTAAPNSTHFIRGLVTLAPGRGFFRAVPLDLGDNFRASPPPFVERFSHPPGVKLLYLSMLKKNKTRKCICYCVKFKPRFWRDILGVTSSKVYPNTAWVAGYRVHNTTPGWKRLLHISKTPPQFSHNVMSFFVYRTGQQGEETTRLWRHPAEVTSRGGVSQKLALTYMPMPRDYN